MKRKIITKFEQPYPDEYYSFDIIKQQQEFKTQIPYKIEQENIPENPREFYNDFGFVLHPETNKPIIELAPYQYQIWESNAKTKIVVKPQKSGITTSCLLEDFQTAITKGRGKDILIVGQTKDHAVEHLYTLKRMIVDSPKYRKYLITDAKELYFKEEKTKLGTIYIKNPDNPFRPTRIIATGFSHRQLWSWKNVFRIHMSDVVASEIVDDESVYAAAKSRLANTNGDWLVESPPKGSNNYFYRMYEMYKDNKDPNVQVFVVSVEDAIKYKITTRDFIESERKRLGHLFAAFYGSSFIEASGNLFSIESIDKAVSLGKQFNPDTDYRQNSIKIITVDLGWSTSKLVILVIEWNREHRQLRILHGEEHQSPLFDFSINRVLELRKKYGNVLNIYFDATSRNEWGMALKNKINEISYWPKVKQIMVDSIHRNIPVEKRMVVVPVIFSTENKLKMSTRLQQILDDPKGLIAIPPKLDRLIISLKSAVFDQRGLLDKYLTVNDDWLDSLFLCTKFFRFQNEL